MKENLNILKDKILTCRIWRAKCFYPFRGYFAFTPKKEKTRPGRTILPGSVAPVPGIPKHVLLRLVLSPAGAPTNNRKKTLPPRRFHPIPSRLHFLETRYSRYPNSPPIPLADAFSKHPQQ